VRREGCVPLCPPDHPQRAGGYPQTVLLDSPAAYWRLGETSGTTAADSANGFAGTYTGGYTLDEPGALAEDNNPSALFNGSTGCVDCGAVSPIAGGGDFTVEAWINVTAFVEAVAGNWVSYAVAKGADYLYDVGGNTTNAYGLAVGGGTDGSGNASAGAAIYFMCGLPNPTYNSYLTWVTSISPGQWYHVVGVKQGSTMSLYVNGQLKASQAYSGSINADTTLEMLIGKTQRGAPYTYPFDGKVDEVALYNTALSAERILAHYNAGTGADAWVWAGQERVEIWTSNARGQETTHTNEEGNLTLTLRFPEANPDGDYDVYDPSLSNNQYGRVSETIVDADPSTVMTLIGADGDMAAFISGIIPRTNTPGTYLNLVTSYQGTSLSPGCTACNYDPLGNVLSSIDPRGNLTQYHRNELGEVYRVTSPAPYNFQVETSYDANRNVTQVDTQDWVVQFTSSSPSDPNYAKFTLSGSGFAYNLPMMAGPGGSVRPGWFSNLFTFDLLDNQIEQDIDATGSSPSSLVTTIAFDFNQNPITTTLPNGNLVEQDYDERDLDIATRQGYDPGAGQPGAVTVRAFDGNQNLIDVVGPAVRGTSAQRLTVVINDAFFGSSALTHVGDWVVQNTFDGFDRNTMAVDAAGGVVQATFDPNARSVAGQTYGSPGGPTPTDRTGSGNVLLASNEASYDEAGRAYEKQQDVFLSTGLSGSTPIHTVPSGRTITHTGGGLAANSTTNSNTAAVTLTAGGTSYVLSRIVFDRAGRTIATATDNGAIATTAFDGANRAIVQNDALGNSVQNTFDANGNLIGTNRSEVCTISGSIAPETFGSYMMYDVMNQRVVLANQGADGTLSSSLSDTSTLFKLTGFDSRGSATNFIDPKQNTSLAVFDGASRDIQVQQHLRTNGDGTQPITETVTTQKFFDGNSNFIRLIDDNGGTTNWLFDTLDRNTSMIFHDGSTRTSVFDLANDVIGYTDENGSVFANTWDVLGRKIAVAIAPAAGVSGSATPSGTPAGTLAQTFEFDGLSRPTFCRDSVGTFGGSGLANADDGFSYDSINRKVEEQQTYISDTRYITNSAYISYPATGFTFPSARQIDVGFDALYRKNAINETSGGASIAAWQFFGYRTATVTLGNGIVTSFMNNAQTRSAIQSGQPTPAWGDITTDQLGYDGAGRLIGKRHFTGSSVLVCFTAAYDLSGNKQFERPLHAESRAALCDSYDSMNRLLEYQRGVLNSGGGSLSSSIGLPGTNQEQAYNLDALGNWSSTRITPEGGTAAVQSRTNNKLNQVTAYGVSPVSTPVYYDQGNNSGTPPQNGNGNIINDGTRINAFDALNRLITVNRASDDAPVSACVYDAAGRRIVKNVLGAISGAVPTGVSRYLYDGQQIVEELAGTTGSTTIQYLWGQYVDELIQLKALTTIGPQPLAAGNYYLLSDLLYSSAALTNSTGGIVEAFDTDAYGDTLLFSGPGMSGWFNNDDVQAAWSACRYVFTGREYDAETELYFYRARYYGPGLGRFLSRDPLLYSFELGIYEYVGSRPTLTGDPAGLGPCSCTGVKISFDHDPVQWEVLKPGENGAAWRVGFNIITHWTFKGDPDNIQFGYDETGSLKATGWTGVFATPEMAAILKPVGGVRHTDAEVRAATGFSVGDGQATYVDPLGTSTTVKGAGSLTKQLVSYTVQARCKGSLDHTWRRSNKWKLWGIVTVKTDDAGNPSLGHNSTLNVLEGGGAPSDS